ncbi:solute carrier family 43 member 3a [Trichomycterus rosablanca]|uniref:solute carrier family 43 member 3a n=1 Tax=Trichomycterus rosablanca TaxID=2290929 RepID=UPI002F35A391
MSGRDGGSGKRVRFKLTLVTGLLECLCFSGVVFGFASLVFVLKADGYFEELGVDVTDTNGTVIQDSSAQDERFSLVFTVASFMNNFITLPIGFIFDHYGTMVTRLLAIFLYTSGTLLVALSSKALSVLLFPALSCIAMGGIMLLLTNMQVGNLFGTRRSTIITLYNGAFDSSSSIFLIIKVLYETGISLRTSFLFLSACSLVHLLRSFFLMPKSHIPHPIPKNYTYGVSCGKSSSYSVEEYEIKQKLNRSLGPEKTEQDGESELNDDGSSQKREIKKNGIKDNSFKSCVLSWFFLWHLVWLSVMQLRHYLYIGTLNPMLNQLANQDPATVSQYTNAFAFTQLCGILCAPWNGLLMDRHKGKKLKPGQTEREADLNSSILSLFLTSLQCFLFSVSATVPVLPLQYVTFILQVLNRSFLYGGNAAFISIAFPPQHFGKLYGLAMSLSAVVSLLQYPCFAMVNNFEGDPFYVNLMLTVGTLMAFMHPLNVFMHCRRLAKKKQKHTPTRTPADSSTL